MYYITAISLLNKLYFIFRAKAQNTKGAKRKN